MSWGQFVSPLGFATIILFALAVGLFIYNFRRTIYSFEQQRKIVEEREIYLPVIKNDLIIYISRAEHLAKSHAESCDLIDYERKLQNNTRLPRWLKRRNDQRNKDDRLANEIFYNYLTDNPIFRAIMVNDKHKQGISAIRKRLDENMSRVDDKKLHKHIKGMYKSVIVACSKVIFCRLARTRFATVWDDSFLIRHEESAMGAIRDAQSKINSRIDLLLRGGDFLEC